MACATHYQWPPLGINGHHLPPPPQPPSTSLHDNPPLSTSALPHLARPGVSRLESRSDFPNASPFAIRTVRRGVSKGVKDSRRPPALQAGHPINGHKTVSGVACPQGVEGSSMAGPGETLGSLWTPLAIRLAIRACSPINSFTDKCHHVTKTRILESRFDLDLQ
jgi:hypothetical protein